MDSSLSIVTSSSAEFLLIEKSLTGILDISGLSTTLVDTLDGIYVYSLIYLHEDFAQLTQLRRYETIKVHRPNEKRIQSQPAQNKKPLIDPSASFTDTTSP
jgi:hypothetical protein